MTIRTHCANAQCSRPPTASIKSIVVLVAILSTLFVASTPAGASSQGCTFAPGRIGSYQCTNVNGSGRYVRTVGSTHAVTGSNVCNYQAIWMLHVSGRTNYSIVYTGVAHRCVLWRAYHTHWIGQNLANKSYVWGWMRDDQTGGRFVGGAKVKVKLHWWD